MHRIWCELFFSRYLLAPHEYRITITTVDLENHIGDKLMKSSIIKRSVVIDGHKTSVSLEDAFWSGLKEIASAKQATLSNVVAEIDKARQQGNLSSAIRLFVLDRTRAPEIHRPAHVA
jgi:predicted DNA-binding ribbon-helix-helix protein